MNLRNKKDRNAEPHTGALNDILFILLLFFLIVSTLANPNVIKLSQPKASSDTKSKQTVVVSIDEHKNFFIGNQSVSEDALKNKLMPILAADNDNPAVVINADKSVPIDKVVFVMRIARELGVKSVLSVQKP